MFLWVPGDSEGRGLCTDLGDLFTCSSVGLCVWGGGRENTCKVIKQTNDGNTVNQHQHQLLLTNSGSSGIYQISDLVSALTLGTLRSPLRNVENEQ